MDMKNILMNMPTSILLYDNNKNQTILANQTFAKLIHCNDIQDLDEINNKIRDKIF
jgi:hypothetical protein